MSNEEGKKTTSAASQLMAIEIMSELLVC